MPCAGCSGGVIVPSFLWRCFHCDCVLCYGCYGVRYLLMVHDGGVCLFLEGLLASLRVVH